jgi:hypothetical protein
VLATKASGTPEETKDAVVTLEDDDSTATLTRTLGGAVTTLELDRPNVVRITWNGLQTPIEFHAHHLPTVDGKSLAWESGALLQITTGTLESLEPEGHVPALVVGMGKLTLEDPMARAYPLVRVAPRDGTLTLAIMRRLR